MKRLMSMIIILLGFLPLRAQNDYYIKQAQSYQQEAEYYTKQALGYEREADYYNRQAQRYLREAEYYSRRTNYNNVKTYQQRAKNATDKAEDGSGKKATCTITVKEPVKPTSITLSKTNATLAGGETLQLTATVTPSDADNKTVTWMSDNTAVATVSVNGFVTAKGIGIANIIATTSNNLAAECTITVENKNIDEPIDWSGHYRVSSSHVENNPTKEYLDNFEMTIEDKDGTYYITSMFGENLTGYNDGGFKLNDNGNGTAAIDISYYNILKYTNNDSPLYTLYVFDETTDDWADSWTLKMNEDGSITLGDFYVAAFSWNENEEKWKNGQLEALYYRMTATIENITGISNTIMETPDINIGNGTIRLDGTVDITVYKDNGMIVFSGKTNRVENLSKGMYIVRIGNQGKKILIK